MFVSLRRVVALLATCVALTVGSAAVSAPAASAATNWLESSVGSAGTVTTLAVRPAPHAPVQVLSAVLLVCLGLLLGTTWTTQALQPKLRRQAEERRRLNEEWVAVRTIRWQRTVCPRCASQLSERDWYIASTLVEDPPDDG